MKKLVLLLLCSTVLLSFTFNNYKNKDEIAYPEGYRKWTHIKTAIIDSQSRAFPRFGGFHHIYANNIAMTAGSSGKFPDGSVFVFDVLEAIRKPGEIAEGNRRMIDVMVKDSKRFRSTGGWGFEEFKGDSKTDRTLNETMVTQCVNCHSTRNNSDYIFSMNTTTVPTQQTDRATLEALNAQFIRNFINEDAGSHSKIIHPDFVCIEGNAAIVNREDYLEEWKTGYSTSGYTSFKYKDEFIRIFGNTALVRSKTVYTKNVDGKEVTGATIYTDTYVKENGKWLCVQAQITPVK